MTLGMSIEKQFATYGFVVVEGFVNQKSVSQFPCVSTNDLVFVYVDFTTEPCPRPFYVGKGSRWRVADIARNCVHKGIQRKYGFVRRVVDVYDTDANALEHEVKLITELKTYVHGGEGWWGANLTLGGDGAKGARRPLSACLSAERAVNQFSLDGVLLNTFKSIREAQVAIGKLAIGRCCQGHLKTSGGFVWRYVEKVKQSPATILLVRVCLVQPKSVPLYR